MDRWVRMSGKKMFDANFKKLCYSTLDFAVDCRKNILKEKFLSMSLKKFRNLKFVDMIMQNVPI